jgi:hypothetical protein
MRLLQAHSTRIAQGRRPDTASGADETPQIDEPRVGDTVVAQDGPLGEIERVIRTETRAPVYVVVAVRKLIGRRYPVVPWPLVTGVDRGRRRVQVHGRRHAISRLSETLPLVV